MTIFEAVHLEKTYIRDMPLYKQVFTPFARKQSIKALDDINISLQSGDILGLVGPNGAGKTTLLRIIANLLDADNGHIQLNNHLVNGDSYIRNCIGYVSNDERSFFWRLTGRQNLLFFALLYGIKKSRAKEEIDQLLKQFGLSDKSNQLFRDYSTGIRKKFSIVRALIHKPQILLLDEVTNSLDSISAESVKSLVKEYVSNQHDRCAIWSTHRFEEICEICNKLLFINNGKTGFFGYPHELKGEYGININNEHYKDENRQIINNLNRIINNSNNRNVSDIKVPL